MNTCFHLRALALIAAFMAALNLHAAQPIAAAPGTDDNPAPCLQKALDLASLGYQPLELESNSRHSRWVVPVEINGKACKLLLDTGSDFIILIPGRRSISESP